MKVVTAITAPPPAAPVEDVPAYDPGPSIEAISPPAPDAPAPTGPLSLGAGEWTIDFAVPAPDPAPVTTIAWRLGHLIAGVLGARAGNHFGAAPTDHYRHHYAGTAAEALAQLDTVYAAWDAGPAGLHVADLAAPIGPAEGPWADRSMLTLILHIHREVIHHGAEIALLRDLPRECVLLFGQEGPGVSEAARAGALTTVSIAQFGSTRSINAGVAAGIAMHAWIRQHADLGEAW